MNDKEIGARLRMLRRERGMNQKALGNLLGLTESAISNYERGRRPVSSQVVVAVVRALGVNEAWLLEGRGEMNAPDRPEPFEALIASGELREKDVVFLKALIALTPAERDGVLHFMEEVAALSAAEKARAGPGPGGSPAAAQPGPAREGPAASGAERLEGLKKELERQVLLEEEPPVPSEASSF